jgi:hypothetical protein
MLDTRSGVNEVVQFNRYHMVCSRKFDGDKKSMAVLTMLLVWVLR